MNVQTIKLYERCLIACANYPEYWVRYVQRMDEEGKTEIALDALHRATVTFLKVSTSHFSLQCPCDMYIYINSFSLNSTFAVHVIVLLGW